jgi:hypothetical protein
VAAEIFFYSVQTDPEVHQASFTKRTAGTFLWTKWPECEADLSSSSTVQDYLETFGVSKWDEGGRD